MKQFAKHIAITGAVLFGATAQAGMIGFEDYTNNNRKNATNVAFNTDDNSVTFSAKNRAGTKTKNVYVIKSGYPVHAYAPGDIIPEYNAAPDFYDNYTDPSELDDYKNYDGGNFFLSEDRKGPRTRFDYYMSFERSISELSLGVYDYGAYGGAGKGDYVTLFLYDMDWNEVASDTYTIPVRPKNMPDPNLVLLSASSQSLVKYAAVKFSDGDVGTGIDNIRFTTVPEPGTLALMGLGLFGLSLARRRA